MKRIIANGREVVLLERRQRRRQHERKRNREEMAAIRAAYEGGEALRSIGARLGISGERVRQILRRDGVKPRLAP